MAEGILDQMEDLGYGTRNSILILGSLWIYAVLYLIKLFVYIAVKYNYMMWGKINDQYEGGSNKKDKEEDKE